MGKYQKLDGEDEGEGENLDPNQDHKRLKTNLVNGLRTNTKTLHEFGTAINELGSVISNSDSLTDYKQLMKLQTVLNSVTDMSATDKIKFCTDSKVRNAKVAELYTVTQAALVDLDKLAASDVAVRKNIITVLKSADASLSALSDTVKTPKSLTFFAHADASDAEGLKQKTTNLRDEITKILEHLETNQQYTPRG